MVIREQDGGMKANRWWDLIAPLRVEFEPAIAICHFEIKGTFGSSSWAPHIVRMRNLYKDNRCKHLPV